MRRMYMKEWLKEYQVELFTVVVILYALYALACLVGAVQLHI